MKIEILQSGKVVETLEFGDGSWKIGRASDCHIRLKSPQISKQHALLVIKDNRAAIVDLGSSNGVFVNGILVRKQRINPTDEIHIVDFEIRLGDRPQRRAPTPPRRSVNTGPLFDGNAALNSAPEVGNPPPPTTALLSPQDKFLVLVDQKILIPYYQLMKTVDWRWMLSSILLIALVSSVLLSVIPIVRWGKNISTQEALARAHTVVSQTVRENYRILTKTNDSTRLTVEACEAETGILACYIIDPKTTAILAPAKLFSKSISDPGIRDENVYPLIALKKITEAKEDRVSVHEEGNRWVVAQPIFTYSEESKDRTLNAVVLAHFEVPTSITSTFESLVEAALFATLLSLLAYFFIHKMFTFPITQLHEQLDAALRGEDVAIRCETRFEELENLAQVINFSVGRLRRAGGGNAQPVSGSNVEDEDKVYIGAVEGFDRGTSDAIVLLDREKKVKFIGKAAEDLLSMRSQYAAGQNISDACRDQSFAGTAIDLADRVVSSLGESQVAQLDINGTSRSITATAHKNTDGEIRHILITIKLGAS